MKILKSRFISWFKSLILFWVVRTGNNLGVIIGAPWYVLVIYIQNNICSGDIIKDIFKNNFRSLIIPVVYMNNCRRPRFRSFGCSYYCMTSTIQKFDVIFSTPQNKNRYIERKIYPREDISTREIFRKRYNWKRIYPRKDISKKDIFIFNIFLDWYFFVKYLFYENRYIIGYICCNLDISIREITQIYPWIWIYWIIFISDNIWKNDITLDISEK